MLGTWLIRNYKDKEMYKKMYPCHLKVGLLLSLPNIAKGVTNLLPMYTDTANNILLKYHLLRF